MNKILSALAVAAVAFVGASFAAPVSAEAATNYILKCGQSNAEIVYDACPGDSEAFLHPASAQTIKKGYALSWGTTTQNRKDCLMSKQAVLGGDGKIHVKSRSGVLRVGKSIFSKESKLVYNMYNVGGPVIFVETRPGACPKATASGSKATTMSLQKFIAFVNAQ